MGKSFAVTLDGKVVGDAIIEKQGLYYIVECCCPMRLDRRYILMLICGEIRKDLGVCISYENGFGLKTRVKLNLANEKEICFELISKVKQDRTDFYPIYANQPFELLEFLRYGSFVVINDIWGIRFRFPNLQDSDQNRKYLNK